MYSANVLKGHLRQLSSWSNQSWMKYVRNCMEKNRRHSKRPITGHSHGFGDQCSGINTWETRLERIHTLSHSHTVPHHRPSSPHFELLRWQGVNAQPNDIYAERTTSSSSSSSSVDTCKQPQSNMLFHTHAWQDTWTPLIPAQQRALLEHQIILKVNVVYVGLYMNHAWFVLVSVARDAPPPW